MAWLIHSAKGSSWKHPMYVKKEGTPGKLEEDGKYYYPDSYKGGRHLPKNGKDNRATGEHKHDYPDDMEEWEKKVHDHLSGIIEKHPDLFKTGTDVAKGIMDPNNFQAVKNTLKAFGLPVEKMSDDEIKKLRRKIADAYDDKYQPEEPKASSKKKKKKAKSTTEDNKKSEDSDSSKKKKDAPSETSRVTMAGNEASKRSKEGMTKKDNEKITHSGFYISHSAKGTTWKKHKYIKKIGNHYYYESDLAAGRKKSQQQFLARYNTKKAQDKIENNYHIRNDPRNNFYFDADHPGDYKTVGLNVERISTGELSPSGVPDAVFDDWVKARHNTINAKIEEKKQGWHTGAEQREYKLWSATLPIQKAITKGKSFISKLFKK